MPKVTLLLTACIRPNSLGDTCTNMANPNIRETDYLNTLKWYLKNTGYPIIFVENSGCDISNKFSEKEKERIEFLIYNSQLSKIDKGKGYKEMEIIEYALNNSYLIKRTDYIIKVTGRLILQNISSFVKSLPSPATPHFCMACMLRKKNWGCDSRFIFCTSSFLNYLITFKEQINLQLLFEHVLEKAIYTFPNKLHYKYPPVLFRISGRSGATGNSYAMNTHTYIIKNIIYKIRYLIMPYY